MSTSKRVHSPDVGDDEPTKRVKPTQSTDGSMGWTGLGPVHTTEQLIHIQQSWSPLLDAVEDGSASLEECDVLSDTGPGVLLQEALGGSLIHIAALKGNGRTPFQALRDELERQRGLLGPRLDGFSQDYMRCIAALSAVRIIDLSEVPTSVVEEVMAPNSGEGGSFFDHSAVVEAL